MNRTQLIRYTILFGISVGLTLILITFVIQPLDIVGKSMQPTLQNHEKVMVNKFIYDFKESKRFDIVVLYPKDDSKAKYIKRIIGLPGETIQIKNGETLINGKILEEDKKYRKEKPRVDTKKYELDENEYFVMGDNRNHSTDSRSGLMGPIKRRNIVGKAVCIYLPVTNARIISHK